MKAAAVLLVLAVGVAFIWVHVHGARLYALSVACFVAAWAIARLLRRGGS